MLALVAPSRLLIRLHHCQRADLIGDHALGDRVRARLARGLGVRSGLSRALRREPGREPLGAPSRFAVGEWVRVLDHDELRGVLDRRDRTRGLAFTAAQWDFAGAVLRVTTHVRRMRNDRGGFRPVHRTVLLDGADCDGNQPGRAGCGRSCPLMFRDEWLEPAPEPAPAPAPPREGPVRYATVLPYERIAAGLDLFGRRDGLMFMPEMRAYAGGRFAIVREVATVYEYDRWIRPVAPVYLLAGLRCSGAVCGAAGPCDRRCRLLWHRDWLALDGEVAA